MGRERIATWPTSRANRVSVKPAEALSGDRVITAAEIETYQAFIFNPSTTARNVDLPAASACQGVEVFIGNLGTATGTLTVRTSSGTTIAAVGVTAGATDVSGGLFFCDGTTWYGILGA